MTGSVHASAIVVGEKGLLIRGSSGSGKSHLSLAMIAQARRGGRFAALIADDRVRLSVAAGRLIGECIPGFAGLIEKRGEGLLSAPYEPRAVLRLVIDLVPSGDRAPRMPSKQEQNETILGVFLPRLQLDLAAGLEEGARVALDGLDRVENGDWRKNAEAMAYFA